jgi:hypothetical protein
MTTPRSFIPQFDPESAVVVRDVAVEEEHVGRRMPRHPCAIRRVRHQLHRREFRDAAGLTKRRIRARSVRACGHSSVNDCSASTGNVRQAAVESPT